MEPAADFRTDPFLGDTDPHRLAQRVERVLRTLQRFEGMACPACRAVLCGHEVLLSLVLGRQDDPRCAACLAREVGRDRELLCAEAAAYILSKECLATGWKWARLREEGRTCAWAPAATGISAGGSPSQPAAPDAEWDAGDMGCGDLVLELRTRLAALGPGRTLRVIARDPGAPEDMPAWCRLTGHSLLRSEHPVYIIRKKEG